MSHSGKCGYFKHSKSEFWWNSEKLEQIRIFGLGVPSFTREIYISFAKSGKKWCFSHVLKKRSKTEGFPQENQKISRKNRKKIGEKLKRTPILSEPLRHHVSIFRMKTRVVWVGFVVKITISAAKFLPSVRDKTARNFFFSAGKKF